MRVSELELNKGCSQFEVGCSNDLSLDDSLSLSSFWD
jgi:hypothetical protein